MMRLEDSLNHVLSQKDLVFQQFYERFLAQCPAATPLFIGVDLRIQALMLTTALIVVEAHAREDFPAIEHYLHVLGDRHRNAGVRRELFPAFRDCLVETIRTCHSDDWSDELADAWKTALDRATQTMLEGYERDYPI